MMKKDYIAPEMMIHKVILKGMIALSVGREDEGGPGWGGAQSKDMIDDFDDEENGGVWED